MSRSTENVLNLIWRMDLLLSNLSSTNGNNLLLNVALHLKPLKIRNLVFLLAAPQRIQDPSRHAVGLC